MVESIYIISNISNINNNIRYINNNIQYINNYIGDINNIHLDNRCPYNCDCDACLSGYETD
jgi:hypothetical protein